MHIILMKRGAINIIFTSKYLLNHKYDIIVEGSFDHKNFRVVLVKQTTHISTLILSI